MQPDHNRSYFIFEMQQPPVELWFTKYFLLKIFLKHYRSFHSSCLQKKQKKFMNIFSSLSSVLQTELKSCWHKVPS